MNTWLAENRQVLYSLVQYWIFARPLLRRPKRLKDIVATQTASPRTWGPHIKILTRTFQGTTALQIQRHGHVHTSASNFTLPDTRLRQRLAFCQLDICSRKITIQMSIWFPGFQFSLIQLMEQNKTDDAANRISSVYCLWLGFYGGQCRNHRWEGNAHSAHVCAFLSDWHC